MKLILEAIKALFNKVWNKLEEISNYILKVDVKADKALKGIITFKYDNNDEIIPSKTIRVNDYETAKEQPVPTLYIRDNGQLEIYNPTHLYDIPISLCFDSYLNNRTYPGEVGESVILNGTKRIDSIDTYFKDGLRNYIAFVKIYSNMETNLFRTIGTIVRNNNNMITVTAQVSSIDNKTYKYTFEQTGELFKTNWLPYTLTLTRIA